MDLALTTASCRHQRIRWNEATGWPDMWVMSDTPRKNRDRTSDEPRRRDHLSVVTDGPALAPGEVPTHEMRPKTIGRLIAQTALIADSAVARRREEPQRSERGGGMAGRLLGRFR